MIAASDPLEFIPGGRRIYQRHPGTVIHRKNSANQPIQNDSILLQRLSQFNISEKTPREFWIIRENVNCVEEELYCSGKVAVHTKGSPQTQVLQTSYCLESDIKHALWCNFCTDTPTLVDKEKGKDKEDDCEKVDKTIESICLFDNYTLRVFTVEGEDYMSSLQFQISAVWATKYGILMEKSEVPLSRHASLEISRWTGQNDNSLPVAFSLTHPLDEICPVLIKHGGVNYMRDSNLKIVFTSTEPSLAVIYDTKTGLHSVYKIRKASSEERQVVCDATSSMWNTSTNASPLHVTTSTSANKSANTKAQISLFGIPNLHMSSLGLGVSGSPFGSRGTSYTTSCSGGAPSPSPHQTTHSRSQSPMATISRCQSPTHPTFSALISGSMGPMLHQTRLHQTAVTNMMCQSQHNPSSCNSMLFQDVQMPSSKPLYPEICLDHVWTETPGSQKDSIPDRASRVFLTTDLVGQGYLGYLVPNKSQLFLVRIEKTNKQQQIIFGMSTQIVAKDAVNLSSLNMIATIDASSTVTLYSGVTLIGKVHISNVLPSISGCNYFTNKRTLKLSSPFPKRSSLIGHNSSPYDPKFEEALHTLSPVGGNCGRPSTFLDNSLIDSSLVGFKEAVGNKITLEYGNKALYRVALPTASTSPLVTNCLQALKSVLQRDLAMQLLVKWYSARNAPGPQDFSSNQEWHLFIVVLFTLLGYDVDRLQLVRKNDSDYQKEKHSPIVVPKKAKTTNSGSNDDWLYLLQSEEHQKSKDHLINVFHLTKFTSEKEEDVKKVSEPENIGKINTQAILFPHLPLVLFSLHLLYEELKLNSVMEESLPFLAQLLYQLSTDLNLTWYSYYYFIDFPTHCSPSRNFSQISSKDLQKITFPNFIPSKPPSIFEMINNLVKGSEVSPFPYLIRVNSRTKNIIQLIALLAHEFRSNAVELDKFVKLIIPVGSRVDYQDTGLKEKDVCKRIEKPVTDQIVFMYYELGMTKEDLNLLPTGIALMIKDVMHRCRERPPPNWPTEAYELVDRQDLAALEKHLNATKSDIEPGKNSTVKDPEQDDGMNFDDTILKLRFNKDHRVAELRRMLNSSKPVRIAITQRPEVSDHDFIEEQERHLCAVCARTMALPVARGMFTLRTSTPIITEQLPIPRLCLTGKTALRGTTIELGHIDVPPNMNLWPLFHNGVAAGLRIHPDASDIDSTWIVYNKQQQSECGIEHSGFLMALGLNGHLKKLAPFSLYEYLVECHETTNVGLLLGLSATHRGTMDVSMTKLLSLHVETLLPPTSIELNVQQNVQVAALMGVGLVYEGTAHRHIAHALLSEIGRPPGPEMKNCVDRESYSLAAGLALGLVVLGRESEPDLGNIPDTLHYYMVGGNVRPFTGAQKEKYKSPSYQIREGDSINIDVTSPGATIALGLMYFNSGNRAVAEWMRAPGTQFLLDFVRPDLLLLRILARSLILWNEIEPTKAWVSSHVPDIVYEYRLQKPTPEITQHVDLETMNQAYCNIIAGACMALGLKYAGSANENAFKTLFSYTQMFTALLHKSIGELAGKSTIETCLNVTLLSCAVVMAGTGNLEIMRICRQIRTRVGPASSVVTYGSHLATHMALGLTFLGGGRYTLSNSPSAVAALIISLFPKFPTHSNDNRYHLQALRHLYVLAAQPRLILPKDIDSKQYCYATVRLTFKSDKLARGQKVILKAPCLLPQLESLEKVELKDERYWEIIFERGHNWKLLEGMLSKCDSLDVKQRAGCLSYMEDPHGFRSLVAQTLTTEDVIPWAARHEYVTSFTSDKTVLNIVQYFLKKLTEPISEINKSKISKNRSRRSERSNKTLSDTFGLDKSYDYSEKMDISEGTSSSMKTIICKNTKNENQDVSESEQYFLQTMALIVYECIIKDKVNLLPLWVSLYKSTDIIEKYPSSHLIWQIKLVSSYMLLKNQLEKSNALLSSESVLAIEQKVALIIDSWDEELKPLLKNYLTTGTIDANSELLKKFTTYCTFFDIPYHQSYELGKINPIMKALFHRIGRFPTNIT